MKKIKTFIYEPEDDVLNIWFSKKPIDYADEYDVGIVHFTKDHEPVYIEVLDASNMLKNLSESLPEKIRREIFINSSPIAHRIK